MKHDAWMDDVFWGRNSNLSHAHMSSVICAMTVHVKMWRAAGVSVYRYSHTTEQRHAKHSYDGTVVNESDAPLCEGPHLWLDPTKLEIFVSCCREARAGEHGLQWSVGSRLIGFEKDRNSLGETQPRTCWAICDSVPVCVAVDRSRPCTPAELLAFHFTQTKSSSPPATDTQIQQGFIDERASLDLTTVDPSRTADEGEDEDERGDEMSEPTQITRIEKRKDFQMDEAAKEIRAPLPIADSSHASSSRPSDETLEQPERSSQQARTGKKGGASRCLTCVPKGALRTSEKWISPGEDGWYAQKATRRKC